MSRLPGISGTLFPGRYLEDGLARDLPDLVSEARTEPARRRVERWWTHVEQTCGPATGLRALFDVVAMPLAGMLGFRASGARFEPGWVHARLATRRDTPVALHLRPWSSRQPHTWRDLVRTARQIGAAWTLLVAPPFCSIVDARGRAVRRSVDIVLPEALAPESFARWWWLASASAFDPGGESRDASADGPRLVSPLDRLLELAAAHQDAVGADLQAGVEQALAALVRATEQPGRQSAPHAFDQALTVVYRILFLLFAESRELVPRRHPVYAGAYSMATLCREALEPGGPPGLWDGLSAVTRLSRRGCSIDDLVVSPFNGRLFSRAAAPSLEARPRRIGPAARRARDEAARRALVVLGTRRGRAGREEIAYADLGVEELGAVYERVLDIDPAACPTQPPQPTPRRAVRRHSRRRKESGTFYTPRPLTEFVVRRTLEPLVEGRGADDILTLRVLDPAMGSGAFLVAACRFLASAYERALVDEGQLGETDLDEDERANIRRLIAERCLAGVDDNPVAVELARLSIWLTTLARGKPLGFLDHRLRTGNSLLGASPDDLRRVPAGRRRTPPRDTPLFDDDEIAQTMARLARPLFELLGLRDDTVHDVRAKERLWTAVAGRQSPVDRWRRACSLWCAQWLWPESIGRPRPSPAEFRAALDAIMSGDRTLPPAALDLMEQAADLVCRERRLVHWPLEFPDIFYGRDGQPLPNPGFDAIVGNPPWEMLRRDAGAAAAGAVARTRVSDGGGERRDATVGFIRDSGLYPRCTRGHVNLYQPFVERALLLARRGGRIGLVLPWGLASDDGAAELRGELLDRHGLDTLVGIDNTRGLFPIHRGVRFLVAVIRRSQPAGVVRARYAVCSAADLENLPGRDDDPANTAYPIRLSSGLLRTTGGARRRLPDARRPGDLRLAERLMRTFPALGASEGWRLSFGRELNVTEDRRWFSTAGLPVLEGKHITPFEVDASNARHRIMPAAAERAIGSGRIDRARLAYRDVSGVANRFSLIAAVVPAGVVTSHTLFCLRNPLPLEQQHYLAALFNSFVLNAIVRLFMGQHVTTRLVEDLPAPRWTGAPEQVRLARLAASRARLGPRGALDARLQSGVARAYGLTRLELEDLLSGVPHAGAAVRQRCFDELAREPAAI
jgi:hypothetical protein